MQNLHIPRKTCILYTLIRSEFVVDANFALPTRETLVVAFFALPKKNANSFQNGNSSKKIKLFGFTNNYFEKKDTMVKVVVNLINQKN